MAQQFKNKSATIIAARERSMKNADGDYVAKVIISLSKGRDIFVPLSTMQNTLDKMLVKSDLSELVGSSLYYVASKVKKGDTFSFIQDGDIADSPANSDLHITTIKAVVPTKSLRKHLKSCAQYVQTNAPVVADDKPTHESTATELLAELSTITNVANMRIFVQDNAIFDEYGNDLKDFSNADQYREALTAILENNPE